MKRTILAALILSFILVVVASFTTTLQANAAPPANIRLTVLHDGIDFDFDFLVPHDGQLTADDIEAAETRLSEAASGEGFYYFYYQDDHFPDALIDYQDSEGFVSNALYGGSQYFYHHRYEENNEDVFILYFTTPLIFKAAVVVDDVVITSPLIEMSQFDFRLTWDIRGVDLSQSAEGVGDVSGFVPHPLTQVSTYLYYLVRVIFTVAVELAILFMFGFRLKKTFFQVGVLNVVTQSVLTIAILSMFFVSHQSTFGVFVLFVLGELMVYTVETIYLAVFVKEKGLMRRVAYALIANTVSMIGGLYMMGWLLDKIY